MSGDLAIIVAAGAAPDRAGLDRAWPGWADGPAQVVAADGGALAARALGLRPDVVVGDGDSLPAAERERLAGEGVAFEDWPTDKEASDLELALQRVLRAGPRRVAVLGAFGGERLDQLLANVWLLDLPTLSGADGPELWFLDATTRLRLLVGPGRAELVGRPGDLISLLPFGGPAYGVRTEGLRFPLHDETLASGPSRGLSNVRLTQRAVVDLRSGRLLIVESHPVIGSHPSNEQEGAS
ncbi:MAG TPA: thiamine diphosphokinase [Candidatus Limnocylindrales bacterium]|nr:thiamine diphosphokinase [Candidatus Limnocylindrales bacterium]